MPVFFFVMIFAIAMDYTVFLLAPGKEHYERYGNPTDAIVGSLAHPERVIFAAGAVMVAVIFTFAPAEPTPRRTTDPREQEHTMRLATTCRTCGRSTWTGCGQHANQVRASSADRWCPATTNRLGKPAGSLASSMGERR